MTSTRTSPARSGAWALVVASVLWGTTGTAASFMPANVGPLAIGASTMALGGGLLFLFSVRPALAAIMDASARPWLLLGALGVVVYPLAFYSAMDLAGVAVGNVVALGTGPVFAALLEWVIERRPISKRWLLCTAGAIGGVALLAVGGDGAAGRDPLLGVVLGLVAGFAYALFTYCSSRGIRSGQPSGAVMGGMFGVGAVALLPVLLALGAPLLQSGSTLAIAGYLAIAPMFLAYLLFGIGMREMRSSTATTITLLEPFVATVLAVAVVGDRLNALGWLGLILILVAVALLPPARQSPSDSLAP